MTMRFKFSGDLAVSKFSYMMALARMNGMNFSGKTAYLRVFYLETGV
jgi:hypothetical protein